MRTSLPVVVFLLASTPWPAAGEDVFVEAAEGVGLDFHHFSGATGELLLPEMMGPGAAWLDLENDGDLDLYVVQDRPLGSTGVVEKALSDRVYRNELIAPEGGGRLRFTDVTREEPQAPGSYPIGVATGDYDNDGLTDVYVVGLGSNRLLENRGDGTLVDVTERAGADDSRWSVGAAFFDYDRDGWLDLWIVNYLDFSVAGRKRCVGPTGVADYCDPTAYHPVSDRLLRNQGDGTFVDVTQEAGVAVAPGAGLGIVTPDLNGDGWLDVYVTNDGMPNHLFVNNTDGTFTEDGLLAGVAVNAEGQREASMGVAVGDVDGDGDDDLFLTHLTHETNTLYLNGGEIGFDDRTESMGLGTPSWTRTGFGTGFVDYDNDGRLDLVVVNGAVTYFASGSHRSLDEPNQLFRNEGDGFTDVTEQAGDAWKASLVSRGAAFADIDNDGDTDILVLNNDGPANLLLNQVGSGSPWLGLHLRDGTGREALGARVWLLSGGRAVASRSVQTAGSYASASDPRLLFGLGGLPAGPLTVRVRWPDGSSEEFDEVPRRAYSELRQGEGRPARPLAAVQ